MRKFIKNMGNQLREQWKNLFHSKHTKISEGAHEEYTSHPHRARGDNWRRPDAHNHKPSQKHPNHK
jgi:hypothetical protein